MTKRQRPWGDSEEDQCRLRKSHQSQKDLDKRSESAMQVVHTKTLDMLFQGARKLNDKVKNLDVKCGSCVSSFQGGQNGGQNGGGQIISPCISCKNLTCANCQDYCDNCSIFVCGQCSIQAPLNCYSRRCLYC